MKLEVFIVFLIVCVSQTNHMRINGQTYETPRNLLSAEDNTQAYNSNEPKSRSKRGFFWDVFQKMVITKNLIVDQYVDTRDTFNDIYNLINDQFSDPGPEKPRSPSSTTESALEGTEESSVGSETTTTTEAYRISRYELGRILGRNFRGLQRLKDIEFRDALNQSHYNIQEYKNEANQQFANSLAVEKKKHLRSLGG